MKNITTLLTLTLMLTLVGTSAFAAVLNVPADYQHIQDAMNAANEGDTVLVSNGTYNVNLDFDGKDIVLTSEYMNSNDLADVEATVLDGGSNGSVVRFANNETENARLIGFKIINGNNSHGGGVYIYAANPTIERCHIDGNTALSGGGMAILLATPAISFTTISYNNAGYGGGIYFLRGNVVSNNLTIYGNDASEAGGGFYSYDSDIILSNSILWGNSPESITLSAGGNPTDIEINNSSVENGTDGITNAANGNVTYDENNIEQDPMFVDPEQGDFTMDETSPCAEEGIGATCPEDNVVEVCVNTIVERIDELLDAGLINSRKANLLTRPLDQAMFHAERGRIRATIVHMIIFKIRVAIMDRFFGLDDAIAHELQEMSTTVIEKFAEEVSDFEEITVSEDTVLPSFTYLEQNYPNPFNSTTKVNYGLGEAANVHISVYDVNGRKVATLVNGIQEAGEHIATWDAQTTPAGMYFVRMVSGDYNEVKQMMLTK